MARAAPWSRDGRTLTAGSARTSSAAAISSREGISSLSAVSRRGAVARTGGLTAASSALGPVSSVVPTYSSGARRWSRGGGGGWGGGRGWGYGGYYNNCGYYGGGYYGRYYGGFSGWGWGAGWGWGVSIGFGAPYWASYVGFGYPYCNYPYYGWRASYAWRYPYHVYYPYYRSNVYVSYPYDYVSYYYDPPYSTYYSDGEYVTIGEPDEAYVSDEVVAVSDEGTAGVARRVIRPKDQEPEAEVTAAAGSSELLAQMKPAQFNFAMGFLHFDQGEYKEAGEYFYVASLEDPESDVIKLFLGVSLFSIGEYHFAAEYLRLAMDEWKAFLLYDWNLRGLYRQPEDFDAQKKLLADEVELRVGDRDALFLLGFVQYHSGDLDAAGRSWEALEDLAEGEPLDEQLVRRYVLALNVRRGLDAPKVDSGSVPADLAVAHFLSEPSVADVPLLPIR